MALPAKVPGQENLPFRIRAARRGDADAIGGLLKELGYPDAADTSTVHWVISHPEMEIFIASDSHDRAIGMLTLSHRPQLRLKGRIATIDELVVTASWRRRGVGRELLKRALDRARVLTAKRIEMVSSAERGEDIRRFCESCGFKDALSIVFRAA